MVNKMKIAMITPWNVRCGIATYSRDLIESLAELDNEIYVVRFPRFGMKNEAIIENLANRIPVDEIDVIHMQHEYGLTQNFDESLYRGLMGLNKPIVTTAHTIGDYKKDSMIYSSSDEVIVHNKFCKRIFGYKSTIIPHGCKSINPISRDEAKERLGIDPRVKVVGYCGFISESKGLETLISAMAGVKNGGLMIGGGWFTGPDTSYIMRLKQKSLEVLGDRCKWVGYVDDNDLNKFYSAQDVFVYPSRYATESGALLMALSHGKAIIASNIAPFKEKQVEGALITYTSIKNLRNKIMRLFREDEEREILENGAKRYAEKYSWNNVAEKHVALYQKALDK